MIRLTVFLFNTICPAHAKHVSGHYRLRPFNLLSVIYPQPGNNISLEKNICQHIQAM